MQDISIFQYIIFGIMLFLTGFVDAVSGGGGLISLPVFLMIGVPTHLAIATNKMDVLFSSLVSIFKYLKEKMINFKLAIPCIFSSAIGAYLGSKLVLITSEKVLLALLVIILPTMTLLVLNKNTFNDDGSENIVVTKEILIKAILGIFIVAIYDGFYGPGAGTLYLLCFILLLKIKIKTANAQIKFIGLAATLTSFINFLINGNMLIDLGVYASICSMLGSFIGTKMVLKDGARIAKPSIIFVVILLVIKLITDFIL